jgi:hypothetical protein
MIIGIDLRTLRNAEFLQFVSDILKLVDANNPALLDVVVQQEALKAKLAECKQLFKKDRASALTPQMQLLDQRRTKAINGITHVIKGCCLHYNDATVKCAKRLKGNLKGFGKNIAGKNSPTVSTIINAIVANWETDPELIAAVATLGLTSWVTELKTANQQFDLKSLDRVFEYGAANPDTMKGKREEAVMAYYELRKFIDANAVIHPGAGSEKAINDLNALIEQYNVLLDERESTTQKRVRRKKKE